MQDGHTADLGAKMFGVAGDIDKALRHGAKEQTIEQSRIMQDERAKVLGQGENGMLVGRVQHFTLPLGEPRGTGDALAFGAVPVATGVIRASLMSAVVAASFVSAQGRRIAQFDGPKCSVLLATQGMPVTRQEGLTMLPHHIGYFEMGPAHDNRSKPCGKVKVPRGP
jgi:hypothetical protein